MPHPTLVSISRIKRVFDVSLDSNNSGWNGYTLRQVLDITGLAVPAFVPSRIRVTLAAATGTDGWSVAEGYIGHKAAAGNPYDFAATPVALTFAGASTILIPIGQTVTSDWVPFVWDRTSGLIVSTYSDDDTNDNIRSKVTVANSTAYFLNASDASAVATAGYTEEPSDLVGITKIEIR